MSKILNNKSSISAANLLEMESRELSKMQRLLSSLTESNHLLFMMLNRDCGAGSTDSMESWNAGMLPRYQILARFFDVSVKEIIHNLVLEFCKTHTEIDFNRLRMDFCLERHKSYCYTLDVIAGEPQLRRQFETMVDRLMDKYNLACDPAAAKPYTIFDHREVRDYEP